MSILILRQNDRKADLLALSGLSQLPLFKPHFAAIRSFIVAVCGDEVQGLVCFSEESARMPGCMGVGFVTTHPNHRRQGVASTLVDELFAFAQAHGKGVVNSSYEQACEQWIRPVFERTAKRFPQLPFWDAQA